MLKTGEDFMERFEFACDQEQEIVKAVKNIILRKHPMVKNRIETLFHEPGSMMVMDIVVYEDQKKFVTQILFCDGSTDAVVSIPERVIIDGLISTQTVVELIQLIAMDHDQVDLFSNNGCEIRIPFSVNVCEKNICGIDCNHIQLNIDFHHCPNSGQLCEEYCDEIVANSHDNFRLIQIFHRAGEQHTKENILTLLNNEQLHQLVAMMEEKELRQLLASLPENQFYKQYNALKKIEKQKKLALGS